MIEPGLVMRHSTILVELMQKVTGFFFSFLFYQLQQPQSRNMIPDHFMKPHEMKLDEM